MTQTTQLPTTVEEDNSNVNQEFAGADFPQAGQMYVPSTPSPPPGIHSPPSSFMMPGQLYEPMPMVHPSSICYFFNTPGGCNRTHCHYLHISYDAYNHTANNLHLLGYPTFPPSFNNFYPMPYAGEEEEEPVIEEDSEEGDYNNTYDDLEPTFEEDQQLPPQPPVNYYPYPYPYPVQPF